jgi:hypothetical protein
LTKTRAAKIEKLKTSDPTSPEQSADLVDVFTTVTRNPAILGAIFLRFLSLFCGFIIKIFLPHILARKEESDFLYEKSI